MKSQMVKDSLMKQHNLETEHYIPLAMWKREQAVTKMEGNVKKKKSKANVKDQKYIIQAMTWHGLTFGEVFIEVNCGLAVWGVSCVDSMMCACEMFVFMCDSMRHSDTTYPMHSGNRLNLYYELEMGKWRKII